MTVASDESCSNAHPASFEDALLDVDELQKLDLPERKLILAPWLYEPSLTMVAGMRGVGKSWFTQSLVDSVSRGIPFGPWKTINSVPCLYLDGEMAIQDTRDRFRALAGLDTGKRESPLLIYSDHYSTMKGKPKVNLTDPKCREDIKKACLGKGLKLLVLDNLSCLLPGIDENSKEDWDSLNQWLLDLRFNGVSVVFLHHTNKRGDQRGTSAREDNLDNSISLIRPPGYTPKDGASFIVTFTKDRVGNKNRELLADQSFSLQEDGGKMKWFWGEAKRENARETQEYEALRMLAMEKPQKEIAEALGVKEPALSKIRKKLTSQGMLTVDRKITPQGQAFLDRN